MKDYTEFFAAAIRQGDGYCIDNVLYELNAPDSILCTDDADCMVSNWYPIYETDGYNYTDFYGYLSAHFPAAVLTHCPASVTAILDRLHILHTLLEEPMCCDAEILKQYAPQPRYHIFNEDALVAGEISPDDERFQLLLYRLETGYKCYIDAGDFRLCEMNQ